MTEVRVTDPNTGGMKNQKLEQYSLVDPGFRDFMVDSWSPGPRKSAALAMLEFEEGEDGAIWGVLFSCQDLLMDCYDLENRGAAARAYAVTELAKQYGFGSRKYDRGNWRKGYAWSLSIDAFWRHLLVAFTIDPESGNRHAAAALWHACCLRDFVSRELGTDDRLYKTAPASVAPPVLEPIVETATQATIRELAKENLRAIEDAFMLPRVFVVDEEGCCEVVLSDLATCDGCPDREACVAEAEAGL